MSSHLNKSRENEKQKSAANASEIQSRSSANAHFIDNRPEALVQRKMQEMAINSPQSKRLDNFQQIANNSPQVQPATQLQAVPNRISSLSPPPFNPIIQLHPNPSQQATISAIQKNDDKKRGKWDVDPKKGKKEMDKKKSEILRELADSLTNAKDNIENFENVAELLSTYLVETPPQYWINAIIEEIENAFKDPFRLFYLKSLLSPSAINGSPLGEPSKLSQMFLLSGLTSGALVARDHTEIIQVLEDAKPEELQDIRQNAAMFNILKSYLIKSNYTTFETKGTRTMVEYMDTIVENRTKTYENTEEGGNQKIEDKKKEAILLLKTTLSKIHKNDGKHLKKPENVARIRNWASKLSNEERAAITEDNYNNDVYHFLYNELNLKPHYAKYILQMFGTQSFDMEEEGAEDAFHQQEANMFIAYLESKEQGESKRWNSLPEMVEQLDTAARLKVLEHYTPIARNLDKDIGNRELTIQNLVEKLKELKVPSRIIKAVTAAFQWGATEGVSDKDNTVARIRKAAYSKIPGEKGLKILSLVEDLQISEYMQIRQDTALLERFGVLKEKEDKKHKRFNGSPFWKLIYGQLNIPTSLEDKVLEQGEEQAMEATKDLIELRPDYWATKLNLEMLSFVGERMSKNQLLSLITQAYYAGERAAAQKDNNSYKSPKDFTNAVLNHLTAKTRKKLEKTKVLQPGLQALQNGVPVAASERLDAATFKKASFKRWKGYGMKPSAVLQAVTDASGSELLFGWSDFPQFLEKLNSGNLTEEEKRAEVVSYIPDLKAEHLARLEKELPRDEFASVHKEILFQLGNAMSKDSKMVYWFQLIGAEHLALRGDMLKSLGLLNREQLVDTGWQMKYFSTKGPARKEAKRIMLHRLRKARKEVIKDQPQNPNLEAAHEQLVEGTELYERRAAAFENTKEIAVEVIMLTISIIVGIITTVATLGTAAPMMAAGISPIVAQLIVSMGFTLGASTMKQLIHKALVGAAHNDMEGFFNVVKDVLMSGATVAAGEASGAMMDSIMESASAFGQGIKGMSENNPVGYAFFEKIFSVSPIEVAFRNAMETALENSTAAERGDRMGLDANAALRYIRDTSIDALLKGVFDVISGSAAGVIPEEASTHSVSDAAPVTVDFPGLGNIELKPAEVDFLPDLQKLAPWQTFLIILGENILTSQNYSVAEQDSVGGALIDKLIDLFPSVFQEKNEGSEQEQTQGDDVLRLKEIMRVVAARKQEFTPEDYQKAVKELKGVGVDIQTLSQLGFTPEHMKTAFEPEEIKSGLSEDYKKKIKSKIKKGGAASSKAIRTGRNDNSVNIDGQTYFLNRTPGDGNCFYRAVYEALNNEASDRGTQAAIREHIVNAILDNEQVKTHLVGAQPEPEALRNVINGLLSEGEWADDFTPSFAAEALDIRINIFNTDGSLRYVASPTIGNGNETINLQYTGNHYNSFTRIALANQPIEEGVNVETRKKRTKKKKRRANISKTSAMPLNNLGMDFSQNPLIAPPLEIWNEEVEEDDDKEKEEITDSYSGGMKEDSDEAAMMALLDKAPSPPQDLPMPDAPSHEPRNQSKSQEKKKKKTAILSQ